MHVLETILKNFRFNSIYQQGPLEVRWFKLIDDEDGLYGECLTMGELNTLTNYVSKNKMNFENQNYFTCDGKDIPVSDIYDFQPIQSNFPENLILKRKLEIEENNGKIYSSMEIELLDNYGNPNHNYALDFDLFGVILNVT